MKDPQASKREEVMETDTHTSVMRVSSKESGLGLKPDPT